MVRRTGHPSLVVRGAVKRTTSNNPNVEMGGCSARRALFIRPTALSYAERLATPKTTRLEEGEGCETFATANDVG